MKKILLFLIFLSVLLYSQKNIHESEAKSKSEYYSKLKHNPEILTENQNYFDANYYKLEINLDTVTTKDSFTLKFQGKTTIEAKIVQQAISVVDLNFTQGMKIDVIDMDGKVLTYSQSNNILTINLGRQYNIGEKIKVTITYNGTPATSGFGSFSARKHNDNILIASLSEPYGARDWWPCKDIPSDKADSADIIITVPRDFVVASNGILKNTTETQNKKTYFWHESYPISTYLISVTIYPYKIYTTYYKYGERDSMPVQNFLCSEPDLTHKSLCDKTPEMIKIFSEIFGEYPFLKEKYGHAEFLFSGGMEHQTCTSLGTNAWFESIVVHELAHQWWGDMITCKDFHHIWLNEGFATYSEALYAEKAYGKSSYNNEMQGNFYDGPGTIYVQNDQDQNKLFSSNLSYNKASWVLHMLRHVVKDPIFFKILKAYYADSRYKYSAATTEDFRAICEAYYGKDLSWFFNEWIYGEYIPLYTASWSKTFINNKIKIEIKITQTQTNQIFTMPIDITFSTAKGDTTIVVWDSLKTQDFSFLFENDIKSMNIDKDNWILKKVTLGEMVKIDEIRENYNFILEQNFPNPFNSSTNIYFTLPRDGNINFRLYDLLGRKIQEVSNMRYEKGRNMYSYKAENLSTGLYFYEIFFENFYIRRKMILIR